jgi:hypothetical protein
MSGKFLIDVTDARFNVPWNADVLEFIRRKNPFAHSDVGSLLLALGKGIPGARAYCPSYSQCAYVVLHTEAWRIFAIAFDMRGLAFRLSPGSASDALANGGAAAPQIGPNWMTFAPWGPASAVNERANLERWCTQAFADATSEPTPT